MTLTEAVAIPLILGIYFFGQVAVVVFLVFYVIEPSILAEKEKGPWDSETWFARLLDFGARLPPRHRANQRSMKRPLRTTRPLPDRTRTTPPVPAASLTDQQPGSSNDRQRDPAP